MTLGPDRFTRARWLRGPLFYPEGEGGGSVGDDGKSKTEGGDPAKDEKKPDGEGGKGGDDKSKKSVVVELEGKKYVLQDHVNELVGTARTEGETKGRKDVEDEAKRKALEEQGDFKKLWEESEAKRVAAEKERDDAKLDALRRTIGEEFGLSAKVSSRLVGTTEKQLRADAEEVAKDLGIEKKDEKRQAPTTEGGTGSKTRQKSEGGDKGGGDNKRKRPFAFQSANDVSRWGSDKS